MMAPMEVFLVVPASRLSYIELDGHDDYVGFRRASFLAINPSSMDDRRSILLLLGTDL